MIDVEDARQLVGDITKLELELVVKTYKPSTFLGYYACKEQEGPIPNTIGETISSSTSTFTDEDGCVYIFDKTTGEVLHKLPSTNPTKKVVSLMLNSFGNAEQKKACFKALPLSTAM